MLFDLLVPEQGWGTGATRPGDAQLTRGDVVVTTTTISSSHPPRISRVKEQISAPGSFVAAGIPIVRRANVLGTFSMDLLSLCKTLTAKYALVSVEPVDSKTFQLACSTLPIDCITIDMSKRWEWDATSLKRAVARGLFVELQLGGVAVTAATAAVATAGTAKFKQARVPRSTVVLSSGRGATFPLSPEELVHTAQMLGMSRCRSVMGVQENPALLLKYAAERRRTLG